MAQKPKTGSAAVPDREPPAVPWWRKPLRAWPGAKLVRPAGPPGGPSPTEPADTAVHEALRIMSWAQFAQLVGELLREQGYSVQEAGARVAEASVHFVLRRGRERRLVQCRHWRAARVGVEALSEFEGVVAAHGADGGLLVTIGEFSEAAQEWARGRPLQLVDGRQLSRWIDAAAAAPSRPAGPGDNAGR